MFVARIVLLGTDGEFNIIRSIYTSPTTPLIANETIDTIGI